MRVRASLLRAAGVLLLPALLASACTTEGLAFRVDERIEIVRPEDRAQVSLPFRLEWTVEDFRVGEQPLGGNGQYFAVFVDRAPMGPGESIDALADEGCERSPECPNEAWLNDHFVHVTTQTSLTIDRIPADTEGTRTGASNLHTVIIVLMDEDDTRIGESAFAVEVRIAEQGQGQTS